MMNICKCGCGQEVSWPKNKYIKGHHLKNKHRPKKVRDKISKSVTEVWSNPSYKKKMKKIFKEKGNLPEHKQKMSELGKKNWQNKTYRKKMTKMLGEISRKNSKSSSKRMKKHWSNPKKKARTIKKIKENYKDPIFKEEWLKSLVKRDYSKLIEYTKSEEGRAKQSERSKEYWSVLENRLSMSEQTKKLWKNPIYRRNVLNGLRNVPENIKEERTRKILKALFKRPTGLETKYNTLFQKYTLPFTYCGDGGLIIGGKCPDFYENNGKKICVEVSDIGFRKVFYNNITKKEYEKQRINHFKKYGWKCLVLWASDLESEEKLLNKIKKVI